MAQIPADASAGLAVRSAWNKTSRLAVQLSETSFARHDAFALTIFVADFTLYFSLLFVALAPFGWAINITGSAAAGVIIGVIFTLGHDACHDALTAHPRLNIWLARVAFIPSAHAASLWILGHNQIHHGFTNLKGRDYVWAPMSPAEYAVASAGRRAFYRLCRGPFGALPYRLVNMWWKKFFLPIAPEARRRWRHHVFDSGFVLLSQGGMIAALMATGQTLDPAKPLWLIVVLGWVLPFLVFNWLIGTVEYVHHTHPTIPWFDDRTKWKAARVELCTAHVRLPQPLHLLSNNIMEHNAHHMDPGIPFYQLATTQEQLRRLTEGILFLKLGLGSYLRIVRHCKLFDFERGRWTQFD